MADNYLERKMDDYRNGRMKSAARGGAAARAGTLTPGLHISFPPMKVAVFASDAVQAQPFVAALRGAGITVALCCRDGGRQAVVLSQQFGLRLYPDGCASDRLLADFSRIGGAPTHVVDLCGVVTGRRLVPSPAAAKTDPAVLARELLFIIHPEHEALLTNQTLFELSDI